MFELDVVLRPGLVWARLGGSSSSQILREALYVRKTLHPHLQRKPQVWSAACRATEPDKLFPPVEVILGTW